MSNPTAKTRKLVLARDDYACVCCHVPIWSLPFDLQHRDARGMGGTSNPLANSPINLITLLRRCHRRVESRQNPDDNTKSYWLRMGQDPALTPVTYWDRRVAWLTTTGGLVYESPAGEVA